jgi:endonuclease/exonuclease/phosphatase (EEP) superfamily protein YafD
VSPDAPTTEAERSSVQAAAQTIGQQPIVVDVDSDRDIESAFATIAQRAAKSSGAAHRIRLLTTNVLQNNRGADRLLEIIRQAEPDVALAVEVDEWWVDRLSAGLGAKYPYKIIYPLSNGYGHGLN